MDVVVEWWNGLGSGASQIAASVILVLALAFLRWLILRSLRSRSTKGDTYFRTRKWLAYIVTAVGFLGLVQIWIGGVAGLGTYLGILSAGLAIALADVLENLAGWVFIVARRPFNVGDRVEIDGRIGDVVDVRAFRFTVLEVGNWVDADQSTGRLIHIPNGKVFSDSLVNYTEGFPFIWEEIHVLVTFESDWRKAEQLIEGALAEHAPSTEDGSIRRAIQRAGRTYLIRYTHLDPKTYVSVKDSGVQISGRYLVGVRERRGTQDRIWRSLLAGISQAPSVDLAYPTYRVYVPDGLNVSRAEPGRS